MKAKDAIAATIDLQKGGFNTFLKIQIGLCLAHRDRMPLKNLQNTLGRTISGIHTCLTNMEGDHLVTFNEEPTGNRPRVLFTLTDKGRDLILKLIPSQPCPTIHLN